MSELAPNSEQAPTVLYSVKLLIPNNPEPIYLNVAASETVIGFKQIIYNSFESSLRTCFSICVAGSSAKPLSDYLLIADIPGIDHGITFKAIDDNYTLSSVVAHIQHFSRVIIHNFLPENSPSLLEYIDENSIDEDPNLAKRLFPASFIADKNASQIVQISLDSFNPPANHRRLQGDLLYIKCTLLCDNNKEVHVTCSLSGFYVNKSTNAAFDHRKASNHHHSQTLISLLYAVSDKFKAAAAQRIATLAKHSHLQLVPAGNNCFNWFNLSGTNVQPNNIFDAYQYFFKMTGNYSSVDANGVLTTNSPGYDTNSQLRDWNLELQNVIDSSFGENSNESMMKSQYISKLMRDIELVTLEGAKLVIEGNLMPVNPNDQQHLHIFLWNNILFYYPSDGKEYFGSLGGDLAVRSCSNQDVNVLEVLFMNMMNTDAEKLQISPVLSFNIDYCGRRIVAQTVTPGIFSSDLENFLGFGSIDFGKSSLKRDEKFVENAKKLGKYFSNRPVTLKNKEGNNVEFFMSVEVKGLNGSDQRAYFSDYYKLLMPDPSFALSKSHPAYKKPGVSGQHLYFDRALIKYHRMAFFRYNFVVRYKAHLEKMYDSIKKDEKMNESEKKAEIFAKRCSKEFDRFELSVCTDVCHLDRLDSQLMGPALDGEMEIDLQYLFDMHDYLCNDLLDELFAEKNLATLSSICDCQSLVEFLKYMGINMRYLGLVYAYLHRRISALKKATTPSNTANNDPAVFTFTFLQKLLLIEMIARSSKVYFNCYISTSVGSKSQLAAATAHFLNCLLSNTSKIKANTFRAANQAANIESTNYSKDSFNNTALPEYIKQHRVAGYSDLNPTKLMEALLEATISKFGIDLHSLTGKKDLTTTYIMLNEANVNRVALLRRFCNLTAVKVTLDANILQALNSNSKAQVFYVEDVFDVCAKVKKVNVQNVAAESILENTQRLFDLNQVTVNQAINYLLYALSLAKETVGLLNPLTGNCCVQLAKYYCMARKYEDGVTAMKEAIIIFERFYGLDNYRVVDAYNTLSTYYYFMNNFEQCLKCLNRARDLLLLMTGGDSTLANNMMHPSVIDMYMSIGICHSARNEHEKALQNLRTAKKLSDKMNADAAVSNLFSTVQLELMLAKHEIVAGDFKSAMNTAKSAIKALKQRNVANSHEMMVEGNYVLEQATKLAVSSEKIARADDSAVLQQSKNLTSIRDLQMSFKNLAISSGPIFNRIARSLKREEAEKEAGKEAGKPPSIDLD